RSTLGTCQSAPNNGAKTRGQAGGGEEYSRLQVPDRDDEESDRRATFRGQPREGCRKRISRRGSTVRRPRPRQGCRQHPGRRSDALGDVAPRARREPGSRTLRVVGASSHPASGDSTLPERGAGCEIREIMREPGQKPSAAQRARGRFVRSMESVMCKLADKVAVVTGASKGIGTEIARELAAAGASVVVNYATSRDSAEKIIGGITRSGGKAVAT